MTRWRTVGLLVLLPALLAGFLNFTPLAYASPLDPGWVDGECDDAHQGDVVVLIVSGAGTFALRPLETLIPTPSWVASTPPSAQLTGLRRAGGCGTCARFLEMATRHKRGKS